jgi:hypothetical protein
MDKHSVSTNVVGMFFITPPSSTMVDEESHATNRYIVLGPKDQKVLGQFQYHDPTLDRSPSGKHKQ